MKKYIFSILCLLLGLVIGAGSCIIYNLASNQHSAEPSMLTVSLPLTSASNQELIDQAYNALSCIKTGDYAALSQLVHPEYGIYFSPYSNINLTSNQWFSPDMLAQIDRSDETFVWGVYDGSGEPIFMTVNEYFARFVYDRSFSSAPIITVDRIAKSGNTLENTVEIFPGCRFVDFYIPASDEQSIDWSLLRLVYEEYGNELYLVAIVHSEYTV